MQAQGDPVQHNPEWDLRAMMLRRLPQIPYMKDLHTTSTPPCRRPVDEGEADGHEPAPGRPGELGPAVDGDEGPAPTLPVQGVGVPASLGLRPRGWTPLVLREVVYGLGKVDVRFIFLERKKGLQASFLPKKCFLTACFFK
jgi:hypothetical protein